MNRRTYVAVIVAIWVIAGFQAGGCFPVSVPRVEAGDAAVGNGPAIPSLSPLADRMWPSLERRFGSGEVRAVLGITSPEGTENELTARLGDRLAAELSKSGRIVVLNRDQLQRIAREVKRSVSDIFDPAFAPTLGKMKAANLLAAGTLTLVQGKFILRLKLVDVETTEELLSGVNGELTFDASPETIEMWYRRTAGGKALEHGGKTDPGSESAPKRRLIVEAVVATGWAAVDGEGGSLRNKALRLAQIELISKLGFALTPEEIEQLERGNYKIENARVEYIRESPDGKSCEACISAIRYRNEESADPSRSKKPVAGWRMVCSRGRASIENQRMGFKRYNGYDLSEGQYYKNAVQVARMEAYRDVCRLYFESEEKAEWGSMIKSTAEIRSKCEIRQIPDSGLVVRVGDTVYAEQCFWAISLGGP